MADAFGEKDFYRKTAVSRETMDKIRIYASLLEKWQKKINLVSSATLPDMWRRHFYDSFQLKDLFDRPNSGNLKILDIGSGAGFPGLLLSMLDIGEFHMVESNNKKCAFMGQVLRETGCRAIIHNERVEDMAPFCVDYVISRACASLDKLLGLGSGFMGADTVCLFLKGQIADLEILDARENWGFDVEKLTSVSEESGVILKVSHIKALSRI